MAFAKFDLKKVLSSTDFMKQVNLIRHMGELRLTEAIWDNIYSSYSPVEYNRTYELLHSVTSSFEIHGDSIEIKVFCDPEKMNHFSVVDGQSTYIPPLINYGFSWSGWEESEPDYFHNRPASYFLEDAMKEIQKDINKALINAVVVAFNSNRYR